MSIPRPGQETIQKLTTKNPSRSPPAENAEVRARSTAWEVWVCVMALAMAAAAAAAATFNSGRFLLNVRSVNFDFPRISRQLARRGAVRFSTGTREEESQRRSIAAATGEFFVRIASLLLKKKGPLEDSAVELKGERTAAVTEDDVDQWVVWEQRKKDVEAERARGTVTSPGFSFSAAGLLFPYHLGVAQCLIEKGYITENTPLAGSSAGAIVCAVVASGSSMRDALRATKELAQDCRLNGTAFRLGAVLRVVLDKFLPDDVHIRASGRVRVAITQVFRSPRGLIIDQFNSKEDLIDAVFTSSFIPGYLAPRPVTIFRNRICIDGGLTLFMPPTIAENTVRVCAFPLSQWGLKGIGISPDCNPENRASVRQLFNWALEPADDDTLDVLFDLGYGDANTWAQQNPIEAIVKPNTVVQVP